MIRLDKYLATMGKGTRSEVKQKIAAGQVQVNEILVKRPETKIDPERDQVSFGHELVGYAAYEYFMLHKPAGVISASSDPKQSTVIDLLTTAKRHDLFPVGRLDKDTEGLLLITNDGDLAHRLLAPKKKVDKKYFARIQGLVNETDVTAFKSGIDIGEKQLTRAAKLDIITATQGVSEVYVTIQEGKFHQIKRMFLALDKEVTYLKRLTMGSLILDERLTPGEYRELTKEELNRLC